MEKKSNSAFSQGIKLLIGLMVSALMFVACDTYQYDDKEPDWLGASIYDYMKSDGHYTNYVKLVDDLNYTQVLSQTGSKTLFVANDSTFNEFYKNNPWGVKDYDHLTLSQKKVILNFGMINNAYLVNMLANYYTGLALKEGPAFRRETAISVLDSLPYELGSKLPTSAYWNNYRGKGMYLLKDNSSWTTVCLTQNFLDQAQISNEDFSIITGVSRVNKDAHVFANKIVKPDIACKNGYLNVLDKVLIAPLNMAQYVGENQSAKIFSKLMDRFCVPMYDGGNTILYRQLHPEFSDSIFAKKYLAKVGGTTTDPLSKKNVSQDMLLPFDPGWNSYVRDGGYALESDMAAMFVPTDEAMNTYFSSGAGAVLRDRFKSWDSVPTDILPLFLKRHMRSSFIESVPSRFSTMVDEDNSPLPVSKQDVEKSYVASNGVVYQTNKVYAPDDYISVYGPVLLSANDASPVNKTKIWKWAILQNDFRLYLNSLVSKYSFFVPTDEYFNGYIEPIAFAKDVPGALKFWYNAQTQSVNATVYKFNKTTYLSTLDNADSIGVITSSTFLANRLLDILNMHIVVGGVETGRNYYLTKGNVAVKVANVGTAQMTVEGGGNMKLKSPVNLKREYGQSNGKTYFIDKPIQSPLNSVYKVLSETPQFSSFFTLMAGFPSTSSSVVFVNKTNYYGIDYNVKFFNTFNYTVYVPTNAAIDSAIVHGVISPWDTQLGKTGINQMTDATEKATAISKLERFIRYHFQDNSLFVENNVSYSGVYQSATMKLDDAVTNFDTFKNKYYKIGVANKAGSVTLTTELNKTAHVDKSNGLYNIMTRDFVFSGKPSTFKNIDTSGSGTSFDASSIYTSSTAVIHQIDNVLSFQ